MVTKEILESYSVRELKKEISKRRMKNYAHLKKADLHNFIMKNKSKFMDLKKKEKTIGKVKKEVVKIEKKVKAQPKPKTKPKPKPKPKPKTQQPKNKAPPKKNVPEDISKSIGEFLPKSNKEDTERREIDKKKDLPYFINKISALLIRKLGNQPYLKPTNQKFRNLIKHIIDLSGHNDSWTEITNKYSNRIEDLETYIGLGAAALHIAKILATKIETGSWTKSKEMDFMGGKVMSMREYKGGGKKEPYIKLIMTKNPGTWVDPNIQASSNPTFGTPTTKRRADGGFVGLFEGGADGGVTQLIIDNTKPSGTSKYFYNLFLSGPKSATPNVFQITKRISEEVSDY